MKSARILSVVCAAAALGSLAKADQLGLTVNSYDESYESNQFTIGFQFQVNSPTLVDGLAAWSTNADELDQTDEVGLWLNGTTTPLATVWIQAGAPVTMGGFAVGAITPILLLPGVYDVASTGSYAFGYNKPVQISTVPSITYIEDIYTYTEGGPLTYPSTTEFGPGNDSWGFPGGDIVIAGSVPDACSTWLLAAGALGALAFASRRSRLNAAA